jgi:LPS-assembly protein
VGLGKAGGSMYARAAHLLGATALSCAFIFVPVSTKPAVAQDADTLGASVPSNSQMLLEANTLTYDNDREVVVAAGAVQIEYGGNRLVAQRVTYDRKTGRVLATGNVEIVDQDGTRLFSDEIDVTDDFKDGFVNALRVETTDKTYFAAESAERRGGYLTTFNNGVYTACEPCEDKPGKPPIWRVKARKIIWNGQEKTIRFERARFELFGLPIAYVPYFTTADPTVKRKSGFLIPGVSSSSRLGTGVSIPYYLVISPSSDALFTGTYYGRQGFMGQAEFRRQFDNGQLSVTVAGIDQKHPKAFPKGWVDREQRFRAMIGTKGDFKINPRWSFGWNVLAQTDKNFSKRYEIDGFSDSVQRSELYLTGLNDRNYFDLRAYKFNVQEQTTSRSGSRNPRQPYVLPSFDYTKTADDPVLGGQLRLDVNAQVLTRRSLDASVGDGRSDPPGIAVGDVYRVSGIEGTSARFTADAEWKKQIVADGGLLVTPLLHMRGDVIGVDQGAASVAAINNMAGTLPGLPYTNDGSLAYGPVGTSFQSSYLRGMATAGLELRWPILFAGGNSTHVFEPMAQLFVRPDNTYRTQLGIPNEDAQSFVFDATTLFERDKFSGYDRIEGGTRANVGFRYSGNFGNGWTANGIFGQSYHIAGENSFASPDLVNVGAYSGLETDVSDFVGLVGFTSPYGLSASASARIDESTGNLRRYELKGSYTGTPISLNARYVFIEKQPLYGFNNDRREITLGGTTRFNENWSAFASGTHDFVSNKIVRSSFGFAYDDECFTYSMTYSQITPTAQNAEKRTKIGFNVSFRTLGDFGTETRGFD